MGGIVRDYRENDILDLELKYADNQEVQDLLVTLLHLQAKVKKLSEQLDKQEDKDNAGKEYRGIFS